MRCEYESVQAAVQSEMPLEFWFTTKVATKYPISFRINLAASESDANY